MRRSEFRKLVDQALAGLPSAFLERLDNVAIVIEDWPSGADLEYAEAPDRLDLLGLYVGVPLPERTAGGYNMVPPDRIILYQRNIEAVCDSPEEVRRQVAITVKHEIAHHFGISDQELGRLGLD